MVVFVNTFTVPAAQEERFLQLWDTVNAVMVTKPGYVDHALHRAVSPGGPSDTGDTIRFVNVAHWVSQDAWRGAHDAGFRALVSAPEWSEFPSLPVLYEGEPVREGSRLERVG